MFLALICRRFLRYGHSYMHCCRALALALTGFSCLTVQYRRQTKWKEYRARSR